MVLEIRKPWLGERRTETGLLIVGESHYGEGAPGVADADLTNHVVGGITSGLRRHAFFSKVEAVVTGQASGFRGAQSFWAGVAYFNFCPGFVTGPRERPTSEMWSYGHTALSGLLDEIRPRRILVLGTELWENFPAIKDDVVIRWARGVHLAGRLPISGPSYNSDVPVAAIRHPSAWGFRPPEWHAFYLDFLAALPSVSG